MRFFSLCTLLVVASTVPIPPLDETMRSVEAILKTIIYLFDEPHYWYQAYAQQWQKLFFDSVDLIEQAYFKVGSDREWATDRLDTLLDLLASTLPTNIEEQLKTGHFTDEIVIKMLQYISSFKKLSAVESSLGEADVQFSYLLSLMFRPLDISYRRPIAKELAMKLIKVFEGPVSDDFLDDNIKRYSETLKEQILSLSLFLETFNESDVTHPTQFRTHLNGIQKTYLRLKETIKNTNKFIKE